MASASRVCSWRQLVKRRVGHRARRLLRGSSHGCQQLLGQLGTADQQVRQQRVGLVVLQRRSRRSGWRAGRPPRRPPPAPPSPTRTARRRARRRRPRRVSTAIAFTPALPIGTSSASSALGQRGHERRRPGAAHRQRGRRGRRRRRGRGRSVANVTPRAGSATAPATSRRRCPQGDVHGPVVRGTSPYSRVPSSGSMIQHAIGGRAGRVVVPLLAEHRVGRSLGQTLDQQAVGRPGALGRARPRASAPSRRSSSSRPASSASSRGQSRVIEVVKPTHSDVVDLLHSRRGRSLTDESRGLAQ